MDFSKIVFLKFYNSSFKITHVLFTTKIREYLLLQPRRTEWVKKSSNIGILDMLKARRKKNARVLSPTVLIFKHF